jgi:YHS domain-containing protein
MKIFNWFFGIILTAALVIAPPVVRADGTNAVSSTPKPKPDLLTTCPVSGDKLGDMGKPYLFAYQGQEVKLCCPDCKAEFDKDPAKYLKKIRAADKTDK